MFEFGEFFDCEFVSLDFFRLPINPVNRLVKSGLFAHSRTDFASNESAVAKVLRMVLERVKIIVRYSVGLIPSAAASAWIVFR